MYLHDGRRGSPYDLFEDEAMTLTPERAGLVAELLEMVRLAPSAFLLRYKTHEKEIRT